MRQNSRLDLTVVGAQQMMPGRRDKGFANPEPILTLDWNVLKIGIGGRNTARGRDGLVQRRMKALGLRVDQ